MHLSFTLSRYVARQFTLWFGSFFGGLAAIILIADLLELLRRGASKSDAGFSVLVELAFLKLPQTAQNLLPFAILFGGIMAFWRLTRSQELIVMRAVGVSVWQFMAPALVVTLLVGLLKVGLFNPIAAITFARYEALEAKVMRNTVVQTTVSPTGLWLRQTTDQGHAIIHASHVTSDLKTLETVMVLMYDPQNNFIGRVDAQHAELLPGEWRLEGANYAVSGQPSQSIGTYRLPTDYTLEKIQDSFGRPETMSFWALPSFIELLEKAGFSAIRHRLYLQSQLASPLLLCAMVLIAATFSLRPARRGGVLRMVGGGVLVGFVFYFSTYLVYNLGLSTLIPVSLAAWAPAVVTSLLGIATLLHMEDG